MRHAQAGDEGPFGDPAGAGLLHVARAVSRLREAEAPARRRPVFHVTAITHRKDAVYPATIVPRLRDETFPAHPASRDELPRDRGSRDCGTLPTEGVFHNLVFVSIRKTYPMQAYKSPCGRPPGTASGAYGR